MVPSADNGCPASLLILCRRGCLPSSRDHALCRRFLAAFCGELPPGRMDNGPSQSSLCWSRWDRQLTQHRQLSGPRGAATEERPSRLCPPLASGYRLCCQVTWPLPVNHRCVEGTSSYFQVSVGHLSVFLLQACDIGDANDTGTLKHRHLKM